MEQMGHQIAEARKRKGLTQEALANQLNVTRQTVSKWENNETKPDLESVQKLCAILDLKMEDFKLPTKVKKKNTMDVKWIIGIVCLLVGIGIGILLSSLVVQQEIPDDLIISQEIHLLDYLGKVQYQAVAKEDLSKYEVSCIYEDATMDNSKEFAAKVSGNLIRCTEWVTRDHECVIFIRIKRGKAEKLSYAHRFTFRELWNMDRLIEIVE